MNLAPVVLFVYNRLEHTKKTIQALQKNTLANRSELFIFSDAAKNEGSIEAVNEVREYIKSVTGFKNIEIRQAKENKGLANSIISGVTDIINQYGKIIVLEDDLVTSPYFLKFMNDGLDFYETKNQVWHISGWNYPIETNDLNDSFLWRAMNCWGWATWADRWQYFEKNTDKLISELNPQEIERFNIDNAENFWGQVLANKSNKINSWAIYWFATIFKKDGLCLNPSKSFVDNIGLDGSGVHCGSTNIYERINVNHQPEIIFTLDLVENKVALERIKSFYIKLKKPFHVRIINKLSRMILNKNIIK